jgi:hypothetical protein
MPSEPSPEPSAPDEFLYDPQIALQADSLGAPLAVGISQQADASNPFALPPVSGRSAQENTHSEVVFLSSDAVPTSVGGADEPLFVPIKSGLSDEPDEASDVAPNIVIKSSSLPDLVSHYTPQIRRSPLADLDQLIYQQRLDREQQEQQTQSLLSELSEDLSDSLDALADQFERAANDGEAIVPPLSEWEIEESSDHQQLAQAETSESGSPAEPNLDNGRSPGSATDSVPLFDSDETEPDDPSQIPDSESPQPEQTPSQPDEPVPLFESDEPSSDGELEDELNPQDAIEPPDRTGEPTPLPSNEQPEPIPVPPASPTPSEDVIGDVVELSADRQTYDQFQQVFTAEGNVEMRFRGAVLNADRLQVNLPNRIAVAEGDAVITRGEQVLRGDRLVYNLGQDQGTILNARGEVFLPEAGSDLGDDDDDQPPPVGEQLAEEQPPLQGVFSSGGVNIDLGVGRQSGFGGSASGTLQRLRFEADEITFTSQGWEATNVRITNDPFSPPELELRSSRATFRRLSPTRSEIRARNPRLVFDQGFSLPLLRDRVILDSRSRNPAIVQFGFDEEDRGGLFVERTFEPLVNPFFRLSVTPQILLQRAIDNDDGLFDLQNLGLLASLDANLPFQTILDAEVELTSLDFSEAEFADDELRAVVRLRRLVLNGHTVTLEYNYRDRLFNGSLGFQTVDESFGVIFTSPNIILGNTGIQLNYQASIQRITDDITAERRDDILGPVGERDDDIGTLTRYQVAAELRRLFFLWQGTPLPATREEGLRYTPNPVVPFLAILPSVRGVVGLYSSGDTQPILTGRLTLLGQFGHFSRRFFDYLGFNITYSRSTEGSESPFNFDQLEDREVFSAGATVQLFGPFRAGFQTSINLDSSDEFNTSYILEYSRRTYGIILRYNPDRETGSLGLRISDFNWTGTPAPFDSDRTVDSGVTFEQQQP